MESRSTYFAHGLGFHSEIPLAGTTPADTGDITIAHGDLPAPSNGIGATVDGRTVHIEYADTGTFRLHDGSEIIVDPYRGTSDSLVRRALLAWPLGILLHQRGRFVLHASAVDIDGRAVAFLGEKGQGKSTLAAALYDRGHVPLVDDMIALSDIRAGHGIELDPGFPLLKLHPAVEEAVRTGLTEIPGVSRFEKSYYRVDRTHPQPSVPLTRIYVLEDGQTGRIEPVAPSDAVATLIQHTYAGKLLTNVDLLAAEEQFDRCTAIAGTVPIKRLPTPDRNSIDEVASLVEEDLNGGG